MSQRLPLLFSVPLLAVAMASCGSSREPGTGHHHPSGLEPDGGQEVDDGGQEANEFISCTDDPRADHYAAGMQKSGRNNLVKVTLVSSDHGPPIKGTNNWTVLVTDSAGALLSDAALKVTLFMPDHGHGSPVKPTANALDGGQYALNTLYLFMAGLWEVRLEMTPRAGTSDGVVFSFCVER